MSRVRPPSSRRIRVVLISALTLALPFTARTDSTPSGPSREPLVWMTQTASGEQRLETVERNTLFYRLTTAEGKIHEITAPADGEADVIVKLSEPALATAVEAFRSRVTRAVVRDAGGSRGRLSRQVLALRRRLEDQQQRFRSALAALQAQKAAPQGASRTPVIRHAYQNAFNGVALRASHEVIEAVRRLPGVVGVYPNRTLTADLSESVPLVGAPEAWALGLTGAGVVVAIVDTGIDYTHPDLGGCLGPACRVIGGYDFVSHDSDPKDDHGHGTHVAGIVAANGTLKGMAPDARLMAFKVLDQRGSGTASDIIAAIDRACDPDGDPLTDDAVDVINMSLGGSGDPDDPLSQAVDNAAAAGVVSVVAAGNSGENGYGTVGSPGCARGAITVGATDKNDVLQEFSSKGPALLTDAIKPDIVAPGAAINSTLPAGAYAANSGTSMAAPHVAGAAALLRQRDPAFSPEVVKSLLMTSAQDLGLNPFAQGSGRLDVLAAVQARTIVTPASLSLGYDDPREAAFDRSLAVTITNTSGAAKQYAISVAPGLPAGAAAAVAPASLALAPGQSGSFTFSLHADNAVLPNVADGSSSYQSHLRVESDGEAIRVPFAFVKTPTLTLTFDQDPNLVVVQGRSERKTYYMPGRSLSVRLSGGEYDVVAHFYRSEEVERLWTVFRENVAVSGGTTLAISREEAEHPVAFDPRDEHGEPVIPDSLACDFTRRADGLDFGLGVIFLEPVPADWRMSTISQRYGLTVSIYGIDGEKAYTPVWFQKGLAGPVTFRNDAESLRRLSFRVDAEPGVASLYVVNGNVHVAGRLGTSAEGIGGLIRAPFVMQRYLLPVADPEAYHTHNQEWVKRTLTPADLPTHKTPLLQVTRETVRFHMAPQQPSNSVIDWDPSILLGETRDTDFVIGMEPYSWFGRFVNRPAQVRIGSSLGGKTWPFVGQMMDYRTQQHAPFALGVPFDLYQDATLVRQGKLANNSRTQDGLPLLLDVTPGRYTLRLHGPSDVVADQPGSVVVDATFDTAAEDPNPPYLSHFTLLKNGEPSESLDLSGRSEIRFRAYDDTRLAQVALQFRAWANGPWLPLFLQRRGHQYSARLPFLPVPIGPGTPSKETPVSLKLVARDVAGNVLSLEMKPAFTLSLPSLPGMLSPIAVNP